MNRTKFFGSLLSLALVMSGAAVFAQEGALSKSEQKKQNIDKMAETTLSRLFAEQPKAKTLFDMSYGYAVFSNLKIMIGISGGGGSGVAIIKNNSQHVYMKMGTGGLGLGLGGQKSSVVFLFEDRKTLEDFVYNGWQGDASANAVAGTEGANANSSFTKGLVIYQLTESGLMLKADVSGTKFWVDKKLNKVSSKTTTTTTTTTEPAVVNISSEPIEPAK